MDKDLLSFHELVLKQREILSISGVKAIDSFDSEEFLVESDLGFIHIKGSGLTLEKMDNINQIIEIKGKFDSINYLSSQKSKQSKENIIKKIFK